MPPADDAALQKFLSGYVDTFNKQDLDAVTGMWAESDSHVDRETGERTEGRAAIRADLAGLFESATKTHLEGAVDRIRFIRPDLAGVEGKTTTSVPDEEPTVSQFSAILVKQGNQWQCEQCELRSAQQGAGDTIRNG